MWYVYGEHTLTLSMNSNIGPSPPVFGSYDFMLLYLLGNLPRISIFSALEARYNILETEYSLYRRTFYSYIRPRNLNPV